ncbi:hemerythrin domain-containing protein [Legionella fairfieldensis]|uniref:hemerythrin domain-containing protein n=1 Tax=Legionella fairfieldensis TaxID=45064 RepID=UPI00048CF5FB|nr:hemerythrin domain-containing protein [Legionella fairfieldensis]
MDIYEYLKTDHDKVSNLFKQFKKAPGKRKADIATLIADELIVHAKSEQDTFYVALEQHAKAKDKALHGWKEHKEIENQIKTFDKKNLSEKNLTTQIEKLEEIVNHHVREEEGELFKQAKDVLSEEQGYALKELMHDLKHQYLLKRLKSI